MEKSIFTQEDLRKLQILSTEPGVLDLQNVPPKILEFVTSRIQGIQEAHIRAGKSKLRFMLIGA